MTFLLYKMGATEGGSDGVKGEKEGTDAAPDADAKHINLKVRGQDGGIVHFKIKKNTSLKKLMTAYCERANVQRQSVRFLLEGRNVQDNDTPLGLEMEEGDTLEVYAEQVGGLGHRGRLV